AGLLRRHVRRGAEGDPLARHLGPAADAGQPELGDQHLPGGVVPEHVLRLQVAVRDDLPPAPRSFAPAWPHDRPTLMANSPPRRAKTTKTPGSGMSGGVLNRPVIAAATGAATAPTRNPATAPPRLPSDQRAM